MIVVDAYVFFARMSEKSFQETLLILVHSVARGIHKAIYKLKISLLLEQGANNKLRGKGQPSPIFARSILALYD